MPSQWPTSWPPFPVDELPGTRPQALSLIRPHALLPTPAQGLLTRIQQELLPRPRVLPVTSLPQEAPVMSPPQALPVTSPAQEALVMSLPQAVPVTSFPIPVPP